MTDNRDGMGLGIWWGGLAATLALVLQLPLLENAPLTKDLLYVAVPGLVILLVTLIVALAIVGLATIVIGLPVVSLLGRWGCDGAEVLALAGGLAGYGVVWAVVLAAGGSLGSDESVFALAAMAGGGTLGAAWGLARDRHETPDF
jgi:hypothetical protein